MLIDVFYVECLLEVCPWSSWTVNNIFGIKWEVEGKWMEHLKHIYNKYIILGCSCKWHLTYSFSKFNLSIDKNFAISHLKVDYCYVALTLLRTWMLLLYFLIFLWFRNSTCTTLNIEHWLITIEVQWLYPLLPFQGIVL